MYLLHPLHKRPGLLVLQSLGLKRLPEPLLSQKMSGLFRRTVLLVGGVPLKPLVTTTPPERPVGPDGMLWTMLLPSISMPLAPSSAIPIPESGGAPSKAGHARVLFTTLLPRTSNTPAGPGSSARNIIPTQLLWTWLPAILPWRALRTKMPKKLSWVSLATTVASAWGVSPTWSPASSDPRVRLAIICVPVDEKV